ncbi:MAG: preprotein translocase subunit SecE [Acidimicrobiia bacterium]
MRRLAEREERRAKQKGQKRPAGKPRPQAEEEKKSLFARIVQFLREVRAELRRVVWPTRQQMVAFTTVTLITTSALTLYVLALDLFFKRGVLDLLNLS